MLAEIISNGHWLPYTFAFLMGLSMLIYALLDGYDLGVGILTYNAKSAEKDRMIASIGPFWDANETWLVLGVGLLLVAFPMAHGIILTHLYLPVAAMLVGLVFRGVAFDFRAKVPANRKRRWNIAFFGGSLLTALAQGYMLGGYIMGFAPGLPAMAFSLLCAVGVATGYTLVGACWLVYKTDGPLQLRAIGWAKKALLGAVVGIALVSAATPLASPRIFEKWFGFPAMLWLSPIPILTGLLVLALYKTLGKLPMKKDACSWLPLVQVFGMMVLCFVGLAYSFFPYIVPDRLTIVEAASAPESLVIILVGALVVLPVLLGYTALAYWVFRGKAADDLHYH